MHMALTTLPCATALASDMCYLTVDEIIVIYRAKSSGHRVITSGFLNDISSIYT
jgi:hypothetical protein